MNTGLKRERGKAIDKQHLGYSRFKVSVEEGLELIEKLRASMPGYAIPSYVQEIAGGISKEPLEKKALSKNLKRRDAHASAALAPPTL